MHAGITLNPPLDVNYLAIYFCFEAVVPLMVITYQSSELTTYGASIKPSLILSEGDRNILSIMMAYVWM